LDLYSSDQIDKVSACRAYGSNVYGLEHKRLEYKRNIPPSGEKF